MTIFADAQNILGFYLKGVALNETRINENDFQGDNTKTSMEISTFQAVQAYLASSYLLDVIDKVLATNPYGSLKGVSFRASILAQIAVITPILFSGYYIDENSKAIASSSLVGRVSLFINEHAGTISQSAAAVSLIALFVLGSKKEAVTTLVVMGIGAADRNKLLPERFSIFFNNYLPMIASASGIVLVDGNIQKLFCAIHFAGQVKDHLYDNN